MAHSAWSFHKNQIGDSRGPCSELVARWANNGLLRNSSSSKGSRSPLVTFCSTICMSPTFPRCCATRLRRYRGRSGALAHAQCRAILITCPSGLRGEGSTDAPWLVGDRVHELTVALSSLPVETDGAVTISDAVTVIERHLRPPRRGRTTSELLTASPARSLPGRPPSLSSPRSTGRLSSLSAESADQRACPDRRGCRRATIALFPTLGGHDGGIG